MKALAIIGLPLLTLFLVSLILLGVDDLFPASGKKQAGYVTAAVVLMAAWFWVLGG